METSFLKLIEYSIKEHWNLPSLTDYEGAEHHYKDVARWIEKLHILFEKSGIRRQSGTMQPQHVQLGNSLPCHRHVRGRGRPYPQRIQTRHDPSHHQPLRSPASLRGKIRVGQNRPRKHARLRRDYRHGRLFRALLP